MASRFDRLLHAILPGGRRRTTLIITVLTAALMLSGLGAAIMDTHDSFAKTDRLAAVSLILSGVPGNALPVTLLDVDDATRLGWRSTGATPHTALAELVRMAAARDAAGVLLDFDLTVDQPGTPADPAMLALLDTYAADAPLLMLVRKIGFARGGQEGNGTLAASAAPTPYDAATTGKPNIIWVTTLNDISADRAVRRIRLWQSVCDGASGTAYPSPALVTAARLSGGGRQGAALQEFLDWRVHIECGRENLERPAWPPAQRQAAQLPYVFGDDASSPAKLKLDTPNGPTVVLRRISAGRLVNFEGGRASPAGDIDRDPFAGRVTIIGASYTESADVHETPLGTMPGSLILANSIVQAETLTNTVPASPWIRNALAVAVFLIFAVIVRYLVGVLALISIGLMSVVILIVLSRLHGFETGFAVIATAVTGFALFKLIDALAMIALDVPKRGWRALLKY